MNTLSNKIIAYITLLSGLILSTISEYFSILGLIAIYSAYPMPIIVMGLSLGIAKVVATVWLKQNWKTAPTILKSYLLIAVIILMIITSLGCFGLLSKSHSDQSLVSGDVTAKIAVFDEKIKTERENIDVNRKQLKQMDDAVDQVMVRSTSEEGASRSAAIRKSQQKDRVRLAQDITASQQRIATLNEERAPVAAEVRKVEADVGPIKYIATFVYGSNPDANVLEKAVSWISILIVIVLDPLAIVLLLASQYSLQQVSKFQEPDVPPVSEDPTKFWNSMIKAAEEKNEEEGYVQNEEQNTSSRWKNVSSQISQKDYLEASEKNINEMIKRVKDGVLPFYQVPEEMKDEVKKGLKNAR